MSLISYSQELIVDDSRFCYDYTYSHLIIDFVLNEQKIIGSNTMHFQKKCEIDTFVIDLVNHMLVDSVLIANQKVSFLHKKNTVLIPNPLIDKDDFVITVFYQGQPKVAKQPPWEGGFVWSKDANGLDWVGVACQMDGASIWWPTKDDLADEPDSLRMTFTVDKPYIVIANGKLQSVNDASNNKRSFSWLVQNPINTYNVTFNIAHYAHFNDTLDGDLGDLPLDYYVLPEHLELAKKHFLQVDSMLYCFENKFGPYPFYEDGYKLVETPYLGMEHQSCIAYGNQYMKGYLGNYPQDIDFDFIIIHETAHEWWGNSVSMKQKKDMWIHEAFATYAEALYVEDMYGYDKMLVYLNYQKKRIKNNHPVVSNLHLDTDMYYKGSWILHTLRTVLRNDEQWFDILKGLQLRYKHKNIGTKDLVQYIESRCGYELMPFFNQYLLNNKLPVLEYFIQQRKHKYFLQFRWNASEVDFNMPLLVNLKSDIYKWIYPNSQWQELEIRHNTDTLLVAKDLFLINILKVR